jgi:hypothetical protein
MQRASYAAESMVFSATSAEKARQERKKRIPYVKNSCVLFGIAAEKHMRAIKRVTTT